MLKRVITLLFCLIIVFVAIFGFVVGVVAVPTIYSYADNEDPQMFPYQDQMQDSTAAIYVYMKKYGFTAQQFSDSVNNTAENFSGALINSFNKFCNATGRTLEPSIEIIKNGTGLLQDGNGDYYFSNEAQDLLNDYISWFKMENNITDGTPASGISYGEFGSENGYCCFYYYSDTGTNHTHFEWGSCAPLGSLRQLDLNNNATFTILAPWGSSTAQVNKTSYQYVNFLTDIGLSGNSRNFYKDYFAGKEIEKIYGSPCFIVDSKGTKVYKGIIRHRYHTAYSTGEVDFNDYELFKGSLYKDYQDDIPKIDFNFDYDGSELPDNTVPATDPTTININYNTYNDILNNPQYINITNNNSDDDTIIYNPYKSYKIKRNTEREFIRQITN